MAELLMNPWIFFSIIAICFIIFVVAAYVIYNVFREQEAIIEKPKAFGSNPLPIVRDEAGRTRAEHVRWCKEMARAAISNGDPVGAILDMSRNVITHPNTRGMENLVSALAYDAMREGTVEAARSFVEGFAE